MVQRQRRTDSIATRLIDATRYVFGSSLQREFVIGELYRQTAEGRELEGLLRNEFPSASH